MTFPCHASAPATCDDHTAVAARRRGLLRAAVVTALIAIAAPAAAADWLDDTLRGSYSNTAPVHWEGINFGATLGLSNMTTDFGNSSSALVAYSLRNTTVQNEFSPSSWTTLPSNTTNGRQYSIFLGYNVQWSELVLGLDGSYNRPSSLTSSARDSISRIVTTSDTYVNTVSVTAQSSLKLVDYATMRVRAGYAFGQFLPYAVVGAAVGRLNYATTATTTVSGNSPSIAAPNNTYGPVTDVQSSSKDGAIVPGFVVGLGLDVAIMPNVFLRGEWEFVGFAPVGGIRAVVNTGRVGVGLRF
jgi:outer membrane immunogenic protein